MEANPGGEKYSFNQNSTAFFFTHTWWRRERGGQWGGEGRGEGEGKNNKPC